MNEKYRNLTLRLVAVGVTAMALAAVLSVGAPLPAPTAAPTTVGVAAQIVEIDPETGQLGPASAAASARLATQIKELMGRPAEKSAEVSFPNGATGAPAGRRAVSVARISADGQVKTTCLTETDQVEEFLHPSASEGGE